MYYGFYQGFKGFEGFSLTTLFFVPCSLSLKESLLSFKSLIKNHWLLLLDALHRIGVGGVPALEDDSEEGGEGGDEDGEDINPPREADAVTELWEPVVT